MTTSLPKFKKIDGIIAFFSFVVMIIIMNLPFQAKKFGDQTFHVESKNLALFLKGNLTADQVVITKAPGPILFYTPSYLIAPSDATDDTLWLYGFVTSFLVITLSLILTYRTATHFFSEQVGVLTILLLFAFPIYFYYTLGIMAEVPAFFSATLLLYGWSRVVKKESDNRAWIWLGLGMSFLVLNRPNAILLLVLGVVLVGISFMKYPVFFKRLGKKTVVLLLAVAAVFISVVQLSKFITGDKANFNQDSLFYFVAHQGRFQFREEPTDFRFWDNDNRADSKDYQNWRKSGTELAQEMATTKQTYVEVYRNFLIKDALEHPFWFIRQFFVKAFYGHIYVVNSITPDDFAIGTFRGPTVYWSFILLVNSVNIILLLGTLFFLFSKREWINYWPLWGLVVMLIVFHGLTYMEPRYLFPSRVALTIMAAAGLYQIAWIRKKIDYISQKVQ